MSPAEDLAEIEEMLAIGGLTAAEESAVRSRLAELESAVGSRQSAVDEPPLPSPSPLAGEGRGERAADQVPLSARELWSMLARTNGELRRDDLAPERRRALNNQLNRIARRLGIAA